MKHTSWLFKKTNNTSQFLVTLIKKKRKEKTEMTNTRKEGITLYPAFIKYTKRLFFKVYFSFFKVPHVCY